MHKNIDEFIKEGNQLKNLVTYDFKNEDPRSEVLESKFAKEVNTFGYTGKNPNPSNP